MGFVVWEISGHFGGVYQRRYCASDGAFRFSFVYVMCLNIASYLYGKQIKSKCGNTMCLWMIFICVHLKRLGLNECCTRTLTSTDTMTNDWTFNGIVMVIFYSVYTVYKSTSSFKSVAYDTLTALAWYKLIVLNLDIFFR